MNYYPKEILNSISNFPESLIFECPFSTFNIFSSTNVQMNNSQYNCFLRYFANLPADKGNLLPVKETFFKLIYMMLKMPNLTPIRPPDIQPNLINLIPLIEYYLTYILENMEPFLKKTKENMSNNSSSSSSSSSKNGKESKNKSGSGSSESSSKKNNKKW